MDDNGIMPEMRDPELAKRVSAIEKEFRKLDRRRHSPKPARRPLRFKVAYLWAAIIVAAIAYAAIAKPWGVEQVPVANAPQSITGVDTHLSSTPSVRATRPGTGGSATDPFAGSPAQTWPTADKGVIMPTATKVGPYTAAQVANALDLAHRYILLTRADPRVLVYHQVQLLTAMVVPEQLSRAGIKLTGADSVLRPTLFAPGNSLSAPIRVNGTVNATHRLDTNGHPMLQVTTNLVWAYPIIPQRGMSTGRETIAVMHDQMTLDLYPSDPKMRSKVFIANTQGYLSNIDCEYADQGLLGLPRVDDPSTMPAPSGTLPTGNQAYDPLTPLDLGQSCM